MSNGNLPTVKEGHSRTTCRLVSLLADSRQASAQTNDKQMEVRKVAVGVVMVILLGLACMGVVFTLKHRQLRSNSQATARLVQSDAKPVAMPVALTHASKPKLAPQPPVMMQKPPVSPGDRLSVSPIPDAPNANGAEVLSVLPRVVVESRQRLEAMSETTREPAKAGMLVAEEPGDKPGIRPSNTLPETKPPAYPH